MKKKNVGLARKIDALGESDFKEVQKFLKVLESDWSISKSDKAQMREMKEGLKEMGKGLKGLFK